MIHGINQFAEMLRRVEVLVRGAFPIISDKHVLDASNFHWTDYGNEMRDDIRGQKDAKLKAKTFAARFLADVFLKEKEGKVLDKKPGFVLVVLPHITARDSYIVEGNEVQTVNQLRLRPGPYSRFTVDNNTETFINAAGGGYRIIFNRETNVLRLRSGQTYVYLYPVLKLLGITDGRLLEAWGPEILASNKKYDKPDSAVRLYRSMRSYASSIKDPSTMPASELGSAIEDFLNSKALDPAISGLTLRERFDKITTPLLVKSSEKAIALARGDAEEDDTESMAFKSVFSVEDFIEERLKKAVPGIQRYVARSMDRTPSITMLMSPMTFSGPVIDWFSTSEFTRYSDQQNPIDMAATAQLTTMMGEGGIASTFAVSDRVRDVHPSQIGFIDPLHTPEGGRVGVTGHLTVGTDKEGTTLKITVLDAKSGRPVHRSANDIEDSVVAFHDQYTGSGGRIKPIASEVKAKDHGIIKMVPSKSVDYVYSDPRSFFSATTNSIPFLHSNHSNRALMADRHIEQAVPLLDPESPLVQAKFDETRGYEEVFGKASNVQSPVDGKVKKVAKDHIEIMGSDRKQHTVSLHDHYPLNGGVFLTDTASVKTGDTVTKGQVIANNNFSKDGSLALGKNLRVAMLPYKGWNFEDAVVISEGAAKKLTSEHAHDLRLDITPSVKVSLTRWLAHFPDKAEGLDKTKYDVDGVAKKGSVFSRGEVVIPAVEEIHAHEEYDYARLHRSLAAPWRNAAVEWESDYQGRVIDVVKSAKFIRVIVLTQEQMQVGDKASNRSGGKGIVSAIIPDNEMYRDEKGNIIDMLYNPSGIGGRTIPGLMFEGAAGKIAETTGKKYLVENFNVVEAADDKIRAGLKKAGLNESNTETLYDPVDNRSLKNIYVGNIHVMKLQHQVRKKFSVRGIGGYSVESQPVKVSGKHESAQNIGSQEIYALMASGAMHFLRDASTLKSSSNMEYWRALQLGMPLPPPQHPFVLDKFVAQLMAAGVNIRQEGKNLKALPVTDKDVKAWSKGEIENASVVRASDLRPEKGGLFDKAVTGGYDGSSWSHVTLESAMPSPLMEKPIVSLTGISSSEFKAIMNGQLFVEKDGELTGDSSKGKSHGEGLKILLTKVDINKDLRDTLAKLRTAKSTGLNELNKKRRYLQALKALGLTPEKAYIQTVVPVIPPRFRPIYPLPDGSLNVSDANHGYREVILINNQLKDLKKLGVDDGNLARLRTDLYKALHGLAGISEPLTRSKDFKGFIATIKGRENKYGFFQGKVVRRPQDLSGRSTVIPDPRLGIDEISIPEDMALVTYRPFVVRRLVESGLSPTEASDAVDKKTEAALNMLREEVKGRPIYMNRAPSLHKFSMLPFMPRLNKGQAIYTNPLIVEGYNLDHDGDQNFIHIVAHLSEAAILKAKELLGNSFVEDHRMAARFNLTVPLAMNGGVFLFHLEDFPVGEMIKITEGEKGPIEWYAAIPGTRVVAYDEKAGKSVWADVTLWSKHLDRLVETVELESGRQLFVDDDPRAVYGLEAGSLGFVRRSPADAVRAKMWVPRVSEIEEAPGGSTWMPMFESGGRLHLNGSIDLDFDFGYLVGATAGDGWGIHAHETTKGISIAYGEGGEPVVDRCDTIISRMFSESAPEKNLRDSGEYGTSWVATWSSTELGSLIGGLIGRGAENKHLPPFFMSAPLAFRKGLFAGLMDTDGSVAISHAKKKPQLMANASSKSLRLLQEAGLLAASLSIASRITPSKTPAGLPFWALGFCGPDIKRWGGEGMVHPGKLKAFAEAKDIDDSHIAPRADVIPITEALASFIREEIPTPRKAPKKQKSLYVIFGNARNRLSVARAVVDDLLKVISRSKILEHPEGAAWLALVENRKVKWDRVVGFTRTGIRQTGYDLTVPGYETFMSADGVILSNTVGVHVPASEEARVEALRNLPSKQIFAVRDTRIMHLPSKETILGLYLMTKPEGTPIKASSARDLLGRFQKNEFEVNVPVVVEGKTWTAGQLLINDLFPEDSKPGNVVFDKKTMESQLYGTAKKHPKEIGEIISKIKDLGNKYVTHIGFSMGLDDLRIDRPARDRIMREALAKTKTVGFDAAHAEASGKISDLVKSYKGNRAVIGSISSGAYGKSEGVIQMLGAPVAVTDQKGRTVHVQIPRSYAEGQDITSYWASLPGARRGMVQKGLGTQDSGALAKRLLNTTVSSIISEHDCGTTEGLALPTESRDSLDRVIASGPYKGRTVDPSLVRSLIGKGTKTIMVRSPLKCKSVRGICSKCFGLLENGQFPPVGYHIGVLAGQAVSEPATQMMLKSFHTQGVIGQKAVGFDRIEQLLEMPDNVKGSSPLAKATGKVTAVKPSAAGGWFVDVGPAEHFVPKELGLAVKKGDQVTAGQRLSTGGVIKPQELLSATNDIHRVREQLVNDLDQEYKLGGIRIKRNLFETIVKPMTDRAEVQDAGDGEKYGIYRGEIESVNRIEQLNTVIRKAKGRPIRYTPTLLSIGVAPYHNEDFIGKLMFERLHETLIAAPGTGEKADVKGGHPITQYTFGRYVVGGKR